jgi:hypothetical protein
MAHGVEHLPSKYEVLNSDLQFCQKKKEVSPIHMKD